MAKLTALCLKRNYDNSVTLLIHADKILVVNAVIAPPVTSQQGGNVPYDKAELFTSKLGELIEEAINNANLEIDLP